MKKDIYDIQVEINAVSNIVAGLSNQLDREGDSLNIDPLKIALYGVSSYLDRLADDLELIDTLMIERGV